MNIITNWPQKAGLVLSKPSSIKKGGFACQWLDNVDMHTYAIFVQNICDSRVMKILLAANRRTDSHNEYSANPGAVQ